MKHLLALMFGITFGLWLISMPAEASITTRLHVPCTNDNWEISAYCKAPVDYFFVETNGELWGHLTSGAQFEQRNVSNDLGIRLQRFQMERAFWYVSDVGTFYADSNTQALSIYLSRL